MRVRRKRLPEWLQNSLQGITFWLGYRSAIYPNLGHTEAAIVAELHHLLHIKIGKRDKLDCEITFGRLYVNREGVPETTKPKQRVDLVVSTRGARNGENRRAVKFIIEVKKASAAHTRIQADLRRLAAIKKMSKQVRTILLVVSEGKRPTPFVGDDDRCLQGVHPIPNTGDGATFEVRESYIAIGNRNGSAFTYYACAIEVNCDPSE
jgi:hypothetical protein